MIEPAHPTQRYIEGRVAFHESGAEYYTLHRQAQLAAWSVEQVALWKAKWVAFARNVELKALEGREPGDGE